MPPQQKKRPYSLLIERQHQVSDDLSDGNDDGAKDGSVDGESKCLEEGEKDRDPLGDEEGRSVAKFNGFQDGTLIFGRNKTRNEANECTLHRDPSQLGFDLAGCEEANECSLHRDPS
jgi:hypothetical protein